MLKSLLVKRLNMLSMAAADFALFIYVATKESWAKGLRIDYVDLFTTVQLIKPIFPLVAEINKVTRYDIFNKKI